MGGESLLLSRQDTLNCSIILLLTDASGSLFQSSMVRGKNESL